MFSLNNLARKGLMITTNMEQLLGQLQYLASLSIHGWVRSQPKREDIEYNISHWVQLCLAIDRKRALVIDSVGNSHRSAGPRPTTLEGDQEFLLIFF